MEFPVLISAGLLLIAVLTGIAFFFVSRSRKFRVLSSALHLKLFKVLILELPESVQTGQGKREFELFQKMEQLYAGLSGLKPKGWLSPLPTFAFEIVLPKVGKTAQIYAAVPHSYAGSFEKMVHALYPGSAVEASTDYNIFNSDGATVGSVLRLAKEPVLPIQTYDQLGHEPFAVIAGAMANLREDGEGAAVQVLMRAPSVKYGDIAKKVIKKMREGKSYHAALGEARQSGAAKMMSASLATNKKEEKKQFEPRVVDEETVKQLEKKSAKIGFDVNVRLFASAASQGEAERILGELESAFHQFEHPQGNGFKPMRPKGRQFEKQVYYFSFRLFDAATAVYLNLSELASVLHFPSHKFANPHVQFQKSRSSMVPAAVSREGIRLGQNDYGGQVTDIYIAPEDRRRHLYVIGQTGTGKTVLLKNMIVQDMQAGAGLCFIDPHGDTAEDLLGLVPPERMKDVIYFNPIDMERPIGMNFLEYNLQRPEQKTFLVNELFGIFQKLYGGVPESMGPIFEQYFRNSTLLVMEDPPSGNTLLEIERVLADKDFRTLKLSRTANVVVRTFWKQIAERAGGDQKLENIVPYITSKFDTFLANDIMRPIIAQEHSSFDFRTIMDEGKILIVNLSKGQIGEINANLLGLIIVGKIMMAAFSRSDIPNEQDRKDFYLYIDEFQNVVTNAFATILAEARKYRLNLIVAHQFIGQLDEETKKAVFGNVGSMVSFRVGEEDAEVLEQRFTPSFTKNDLANIDNFNAYVDLLSGGKTSQPFNMRTFPPGRGIPQVAAAVKEYSRMTYGRPRDQIEAEIQHRFNKFM